MNLAGLHFLLSYACTFECDHCFVHSSPRAEGTMTLAQIEDALRQAHALGSVSEIFFEGGEPFLFHPILLAGVARAKELGFSVGAVTNAYFATTVADAKAWLRPLQAVGLDSLSVSEDGYHGEGEESPAHRARVAAEQLGLDCGAICIEPPRSEADDHRPGEPILGGGVRFRGRAVDTLADDALPRRPWQSFDACPDEDWVDIGRLHLDAEGNLYPCQGVVVGNLQQRSLAEIVAGYDPQEEPIIGPLLRGGPAELVRVHGLTPEAGYLDACHLCYRARQALRQRFPDRIAPPQVYGAMP